MVTMVGTYGNDAQYAMETTTGDDLALAMMMAFGVIWLVSFVLSVLMYIFYGIGMSKIAANEGHPRPWLAWIPLVNIFMIPMSVESDVHGWLKGKFTKVNIAAYIGALILSFGTAIVVQFLPPELFLVVYIPAMLLMWIPSILLIYGFYFIVDRYSGNTVIHMILAIVTGGAAVPFQLFRWRNRESLY